MTEPLSLPVRIVNTVLRIGNTKETSPPKNKTTPLDKVLHELFVATRIKTVAVDRHDKAKELVCRHIGKEVVNGVLPGHTKLLASGKFYSFIVKVNNRPEDKCDIDTFKDELAKRGVKFAVIGEAYKASMKQQTPARNLIVSVNEGKPN